MEIIALVLIIGLAVVLYQRHKRARLGRREAFIADYAFPTVIKAKVRKRYPHLSEGQLALVMVGLREYFQLCNQAGRRMVAMPSQVVDGAWHEFILFTRAYELFCRRGLGRFLHHTPAEAMTSPTLAQAGIKRAWRLSCQREGLPARATPRLPLLFAMDTDLDIPDGFKYALDCQRPGSHPYCAGHIACGGGCAGDSGGSGGGCGGDGGGCGGD